jgi:hypothetical protein
LFRFPGEEIHGFCLDASSFFFSHLGKLSHLDILRMLFTGNGLHPAAHVHIQEAAANPHNDDDPLPSAPS